VVGRSNAESPRKGLDITIIIILNERKTDYMGSELSAKLWLTNHLESESG